MADIKKTLFMHNQILPLVFENELDLEDNKKYLSYISKCCNAFLHILDQEMSRIINGKSKVTYDFIVNWIYLFNDTNLDKYEDKPDFLVKKINDYYFDKI